MSRRIFVALPIGQKLQWEIDAWSAAHPELDVRWLAGKNLHVTLVPPWFEVFPEQVRERLKTVAGAGPFDLEFKEVSFGSNPHRPRLIWATGEGTVKLFDLKKEIEQALGSKTHLHEPFLLHLTLARFPEHKFASFRIKKLNEKVNWQDAVSQFVLMESLGNSDYEILEEFRL